MKVAFITSDNRQHYRDYSGPVPTFGTAPEALLHGFAGLPELEVHVISCTQQAVRAPEKLAKNIWFHSLVVPKFGWMRSFYQGCVRSVRGKLKALSPDIVHGQGTERECALSAVFSGFPNVLTIHGNMAELARLFHARFGSFAWLAAKLESISLRRTRGVFCNSEYTENLVRGRTCQTWRVPNAISERFFSPPLAQPGPGRPILINIGVISERKQQVALLGIAEKLHAQGFDFELQFIGYANPAEAYTHDFLDRLKAAETAGYARFLGLKPQDELLACLDGAAGLVHFPMEEAFGLVVAEGLARGLKFFGSRVGGIVEIAQNPGAELFSPADGKSLGEAIGRWLQKGARRPNGSANDIRARYHPEVIARRHLEIYREVLIRPK